MLLGGALEANYNEIRNPLGHRLAAPPGTAFQSQWVYDLTLNTYRFYNGTAWISVDPAKAANASIPLGALATDPLARANHTGTQAASTISNLQTAVTGYSLSLFAVPTGPLDHAGFRAINIADPTQPQDAATRGWVITQVEQSAAGIASKAPVRTVATANVALTGLQTINGVALTTDSRVLLPAQTAGAENGVWLARSGAWVRPLATADNDELTPGAMWLVLEGGGAGQQWRLSTTGTITPGTTPVTIVQFGAGNSYTAGVGLTLTGSAFAVGAGNGILATAGSVAVDPAVVGRKSTGTITGNGSTTAFPVTHNLNNAGAIIGFYDVDTGDIFFPTISGRTANGFTANINPPPAAGKVYGHTSVG